MRDWSTEVRLMRIPTAIVLVVGLCDNCELIINYCETSYCKLSQSHYHDNSIFLDATVNYMWLTPSYIFGTIYN